MNTNKIRQKSVFRMFVFGIIFGRLLRRKKTKQV